MVHLTYSSLEVSFVGDIYDKKLSDNCRSRALIFYLHIYISYKKAQCNFNEVISTITCVFMLLFVFRSVPF